MEALGLMPTDSGVPGGNRVGQRVTHYIVGGGPFDLACTELLAGGIKVEWQSREGSQSAATVRSNRSKTKYTCPTCGLNAWAKPDVPLVCGECEEHLVAKEGEKV